ncbi:hypothetical protein B7Z28_00100 [Candidatus Saccharibacteria bacterium 32-45-3]|nr:MAG: hypothetical protein B7Z28_00100 [Candidatus Saccharibacteria bacterium 32-45-3]
MTRSVLPAGLPDARLIMEIGDFATDIVMTYGDAPRLVRSLPIGLQTLVKAASQNLDVENERALQFIKKFGIEQDKLEGQVFHALEPSIEQFVSEITKSVKFFQTKYPSITVGGLIFSDYGVTIPALASYIATKTGYPVTAGDPWQRVRVSDTDRQKLQDFSSQFSVAIGLAQRGGEA